MTKSPLGNQFPSGKTAEILRFLGWRMICEKCQRPMRVRTSWPTGNVRIRYLECVTCGAKAKSRVPVSMLVKRRHVRTA